MKNYHRKVELAYNSKKLPLSPTCTSNFLLRKNMRIIDNDVFSWYNGKAQKHRGSVSKWSQRPALEMRLPSNRYKGSNPFASAKIKSRHFLKTESVDFSLCKKYGIIKQKRGNKSELYKASKRVLWKAQ